ncbi:hypothetical protein [Luteimonas kalidii]|uniref:Uncharacterized protein n=1 Tax=Luteimonas kalidii TaxID=3042025 RepID=A0ABT6JXR6_9GAMM|nr:hypothetical protein [Luteimonas kalidii]MDH5834711.1 hypothetical protein [Luteimonas kalidii]
MSVDPLQREILAEMGYTVYAVRSPSADDAAEPSAAPVAGAARGDPEAAGPDALLRALLRAAGRDVRDADALALCRRLVPPDGLRDARARRALWPRLRALRARPAR